MVGRVRLDHGDTFKVFGINGLERHRDSLDGRPCRCTQKHQVFELCGLGEVKENLHRYETDDEVLVDRRS